MIEQGKKYRKLGVVEPPRNAESIYDYALRTTMEQIEVIRHGAGEFAFPFNLSQRQKRSLNYHLGRFHPGLKNRVIISRGAKALESGKPVTLVLVQEKGSKRFDKRGGR